MLARYTALFFSLSASAENYGGPIKMHALARLSANVKIAVVLNNTEARGRSRRKENETERKRKTVEE